MVRGCADAALYTPSEHARHEPFSREGEVSVGGRSSADGLQGRAACIVSSAGQSTRRPPAL